MTFTFWGILLLGVLVVSTMGSVAGGVIYKTMKADDDALNEFDDRSFTSFDDEEAWEKTLKPSNAEWETLREQAKRDNYKTILGKLKDNGVISEDEESNLVERYGQSEVTGFSKLQTEASKIVKKMHKAIDPEELYLDADGRFYTNSPTEVDEKERN